LTFRCSRGSILCSSLLADMRVQFRTEGDMAPGLRRNLIVDTDEKTVELVGVDDQIVGTSELPVAEAEELERLIEVADLFELPTTSLAASGPGRRAGYTISVATPGRNRTGQLAPPIDCPRTRELVDRLNRLWEKMIEIRLSSRRGSDLDR
jgi:hypothetical protein